MVQFIFNDKFAGHSVRLKKWIRESEDVFLAVAFLKRTGLRHISDDLHDLLQRGGKLTAVIGTDFWLTEPAALEELFQLHRKQPKCRLFLFRPSTRSIYHLKFYRFIGPEELRVVVGSANITEGGFINNFELSGTYCGSVTSDLAQYCAQIEKRILTDARCFTPDHDDLRKYESEHGIFRRACRQAERKANKEIRDIVPLSDEIVRQQLRRYKASTKEKLDLKKRKRNYREARELIRSKLAIPRNIGEQQFRKYYSGLVGERHGGKLWHSGSVFRSKNKVIPQYALMQKMIRDISGNLDRTPLQMFQVGRKWIDRIDGLGPNVFTEFCNTLRPDRFAVLNKNPTTSLEKLAQGSFPSPEHFTPDEYEKYCETLDRLRQRCGFKDLGETDHFLNFVYWATKKSRPPESEKSE